MEDIDNETSVSSFTEGRSQLEVISAAVFLTITIITAIMGNLAVMFVIFYSRQLKEEVSSLLIVNLSVTDLISGSTVMLSSFIGLVTDSKTLNEGLCDTVCAFNYCLIITSMLTLCFISCDRYVAILHPLKYMCYVTKPRILTAIGYAWFQGFAFSIVPVLFKWVRFDYWEIVCAIDWQKEKEQAIFYVVVAFLMCFFLPGIILIFNYSRILREAKKNLSMVQPSTGNLDNSKKRKYGTSSKAVRSLLIVVLAYFICMTPFSVTKLIKVIVTTEDFIPSRINSAASLIAYCSSAINPLIYGIFRRDFRNGYSRLFYKCLQRPTSERTSSPKVENGELSESCQHAPVL